MRKFIGRRRSSTLLGIGVAYVLAIQALLASVGLGMSVAAPAGPDGLVLCAHAPDSRAATDERKAPNPQPQCPFCFVAAQCSFNVAALSGGLPLPAYGVLPTSSRLAADGGSRAFVPQFRRTVGDPRGPPAFSV